MLESVDARAFHNDCAKHSGKFGRKFNGRSVLGRTDRNICEVVHLNWSESLDRFLSFHFYKSVRCPTSLQ